jgi:hypothetical protein
MFLGSLPRKKKKFGKHRIKRLGHAKRLKESNTSQARTFVSCALVNTLRTTTTTTTVLSRDLPENLTSP